MTIECAECGREIGSQETSCPACHPMFPPGSRSWIPSGNGCAELAFHFKVALSLKSPYRSARGLPKHAGGHPRVRYVTPYNIRSEIGCPLAERDGYFEIRHGVAEHDNRLSFDRWNRQTLVAYRNHSAIHFECHRFRPSVRRLQQVAATDTICTDGI
jgi:hypothetical protein